MSTINELTIKYNSNFARGVLAVARGSYDQAKSYLKLSANSLNELAIKRSGESRFQTQEWLFDIIKEIEIMERKAKVTRSEDRQVKGREDSQNNGGNSLLSKQFQEAEIPNTTFDDIAGLDNVKEIVNFKAIYPTKYNDLYKKLKKRSGGGILLYGLPGTGKTLIAEAIAHETGATFFSVKCSDLGSKWFGETEQNIKMIFELARAQKKAVIFFDEIEAYASNRRENSAMERSIPEFLAQMQGFGSSDEQDRILVIGATNKPWRLDGAFLRPGRFDEKIYVPLPDDKARRRIMDIKLTDVSIEEGVNLDYFVERTDGFNGADVDYFCEKAKEFAIKRIIDGNDNREYLTSEDFNNAIASIKSSVLYIDRQEMESWVKNNDFYGGKNAI